MIFNLKEINHIRLSLYDFKKKISKDAEYYKDISNLYYKINSFADKLANNINVKLYTPKIIEIKEEN